MKRNLFRLEGRRRTVAVGLLAVIVTGLALTVVFNVRKVEAAWWDGTWTYRKKITLNNSASAQSLVDFPIRVSLSASNLDYSHTQNAGQDVRFVDDDDLTALDYEIEKWDEAGTSEVWVKVTSITAASTTDFIWMYYGNASASDGQDAEGVWQNNGGANMTFVHHLEETTTCNVTFTDSTSNNHDGTCANSGPAANAIGKIGAGRTFDGSNDYINIPDSSAFDPGSGGQTMDMWINTNNTTVYQTLLSRFGSGGWVYFMFAAFGTCNTGRVCYWENNGGDQGVVSGIATATWTHVAFVKSGSSGIFYVNGVSVGTISVAGTYQVEPREVRIGLDSVGNGAFNGSMDEVRYASATRSADWIEATYISGNNAMNSFGPEEIYPPLPPILTAVMASAPLQPVFQLRSADPSDPSYLRYRLQVCSNSDCSSVVRTIDQTALQTGWSGQDAQAATAYAASDVVGSSTLATHTYQTPALSPGTQYWWRAYAIDPGGSNVWSEASGISTFVTTGPPLAPTLIEPISGMAASQAPLLRLWTTDPNSDYVRYRIDICSTSNCSAIVRTIDQASSQTGWTSQNASSNTAYTTSTALTDTTSQPAVHIYQSPTLTANMQYWWRAYAIDPGGYNQWSATSAIGTFTTNPSNVNVMGGTTLRGGTKIGQ